VTWILGRAREALMATKPHIKCYAGRQEKYQTTCV